MNSPCRDIDNSRNPMNLTKDRLERAATENQFMNGKIHALSVSPYSCKPVRNLPQFSPMQHYWPMP